MATPRQRPTGVTILAILAMLFGVLALIGGLLGIAGLAALAVLVPELAPSVGLLYALLAIAALFGLLWLVGGIGLWRLRPWAWWLAVIASVLQIIVGAAQAATPVGPSYLGIGLGLIILIYLFVVRQHFGIGAPKPMMPPPAA